MVKRRLNSEYHSKGAQRKISADAKKHTHSWFTRQGGTHVCHGCQDPVLCCVTPFKIRRQLAGRGYKSAKEEGWIGLFGKSGEASAALETESAVLDGSSTSAFAGLPTQWSRCGRVPPAISTLGIVGCGDVRMNFRWPTTIRNILRHVPTCCLPCLGVLGACGHLVLPTPSLSSTTTTRFHEFQQGGRTSPTGLDRPLSPVDVSCQLPRLRQYTSYDADPTECPAPHHARPDRRVEQSNSQPMADSDVLKNRTSGPEGFPIALHPVRDDPSNHVPVSKSPMCRTWQL